jgi:hypothetical protein
MEKCFGEGTNTGSFIDGVQINPVDSTDEYIELIQKSGLQRISEHKSKHKELSINTYIPENKATSEGEYGYVHTAIMSMYNYYSIDYKKFQISEEQIEKLKNPENTVYFKKLQERVEILNKIHSKK